MNDDRRSSGIHDRRKPSGINRQQGELASANESTGSNVDETSIQPHRECALLREDAVLAREEQVHVRENTAHGRETKALQREEWATSREQAIHDDCTSKTAQQDHNVKLRQANEQLVIASVQLQISTEKIENAKAEMTHLAHHDFLTDLPNRMQLYDRIAQAIALANRHHTKLTVLFLDLDRFKVVNDSLGHVIGDKLLQSVALRLKSAIRNSDTVSRLGGDEFVLLLSEVSQMEIFALTIEKIHKIITAPYCIAGHDLHIGATIGISRFPEDGEDAETLIRNADTAMYYAKENGRNQYQFFKQEMHSREAKRHVVESSLYEAIDKRQFVLFYQTQINLESGAITGAETLIRWRHPSRGLLLPAWFLPVAEDCGAIVLIGRWVLREACQQAKSWLDAGLAFNVIGVNVSAREVENDNFLTNVRAVLRETGLAPHYLELELTETTLMKNIESTAGTLHALRSMGVRISIDDFGTGYSSLSYLKRFPVDTIKIDKSFVHDIATGNNDILLNAIIDIGTNLQYKIIAEGLETAKQLVFLRANRCTAVQGFHLNAPMMAGEFATVLKQMSSSEK